jgi:predicted enzyme involved in methoxymalonyl-ACP biosynthesis
VQQAPLARVVQLLAKTNQFNLTTRRHSATEVLAFD